MSSRESACVEDRVTEVTDMVHADRRVCLRLNGESLAELIAETIQLRELGVGFVFCEGLRGSHGRRQYQ